MKYLENIPYKFKSKCKRNSGIWKTAVKKPGRMWMFSMLTEVVGAGQNV